MNSSLLNIRNKFRLLKSDLPVLYLATKDKRTPVTTKLLIGVTIAYFFSPIDFIPDFIPVLGFVDDLFMIPFLVSMAVKTVPVAVLADARARLNSGKSKMKNTLLVMIIIAVCVVSGYYGYQYFNSADY